MAWEPVKAPAECMMRRIWAPWFARSSTAARMAATSSGKSLAAEALVPVLGRGITWVG